MKEKEGEEEEEEDNDDDKIYPPYKELPRVGLRKERLLS